MGLFDKLLGRPANKKPENGLTVQSANHEVAPSIISRAIAERECNLSIRNVAVISNQTTDVLFDGEALYLAATEPVK